MAIGRRWILAMVAAIPFVQRSAWAQADAQSEERRSAIEANTTARRNAEIVRRYPLFQFAAQSGPFRFEPIVNPKPAEKNMRCFLFAGLLLLPATAQAQSAEPGQLPDQFVAAWNAHDIDAFEKLYTSDATWVPSSEERTEGRAAILSEWSKVHQGNGWALTQNVTLAIKGQPKVQMLRPDVAAIFFHMDFLANGQVVPGQQRTLILVANRSGDRWRIAAGQLTKESPPPSPSPADAERQIILLEDQWREARVKGDIAFLERFYAPELKIQTADGRVVDRNEDIALFASGDIKPEFIVHHDLKVRVSEGVAIVTGLDHLRGTYKGNPGDMWLRFTDVLVRRGDAWRLAAHQSTPATPSQ